MLARYLVLPAYVLELVSAATISYSNSSSTGPSSTSSEIDSTSTIEITSFVTQTVPAATGGGGISVNGTGLDYASSCNSAKYEWLDQGGQTYVSNTTITTSTTSVSYTVIRSGWIETFGPTEVYTLCDGYPRMNVSTEYKTLDTTPQQTVTKTFVTDTEVYRNVSAPTCTIGSADCSVLNSQYNSSLSVYSSAISASAVSVPDYPSSPICGKPTLLSTTMTLAPAACMYNHATIQLLYWPVSTLGNHICGNNWTTVEATPTIEGKPNTAVAYNTTFTSPTVYMVLSGAYEVGSNYATGTKVNGILPIQSDKVSSMCAYQGGSMGPPQPMDYADFDAPIPKEKYLCQPACWTKPDYPQSWTNSAYNITATENLCSTIYDRVYRPALQVPVEEFNSFYGNYTNGVGLDFDGLKCSFSPGTDGIFFDPPSALAQVQSAVGPTAPNVPGPTTEPSDDPRTTPASPGPTIPPALPQTTTPGNGTPQPTQPSTSDPSDGDGNGDGDGGDDGSPSDPGDNDDGDDGGSSGGNDGGSNGGGNDNGSSGGSDGGGSDGGNNDGGSNGGSNGSNNGGNGSGNDPGSGGDGNGGDSGGGGSDNDNGNGGGSGSTPTQNVGGIIASIIGANPAQTPSAQDPSGAGSGSGDSGSSPSSDASDRGSNESSDPSSNASPSQGVILTDLSGQTITAVQSGDNLILPSGTLAAGESTSIQGIGILSVNPDGSVQQNGQSVPIQTLAPSSPADDDVYAINGQTYTADSSGNIVIAPGVTLTAGGDAATVSGTTYSLAGPSEGGDLLVNGATATLSEGAGSGTDARGLPQQTGNSAVRLGDGRVHVSVAIGLVVWALM